jgi:hypothetical protein
MHVTNYQTPGETMMKILRTAIAAAAVMAFVGLGATAASARPHHHHMHHHMHHHHHVVHHHHHH